MSPRLRDALEKVLMGLGFVSFWPWVFGYRPIWYQAGLPILAAGLGWVAWRRAQRFKRGLEAAYEAHARGQAPSQMDEHL